MRARQISNPAGRRRIRFSLRTLFLLLIIVGIWLDHRVTRATKQRLAVAEIQNVAEKYSPASIEYTYQFDATGKPVPNQEPLWPLWLREATGEDFFVTAIGVSLDGTTASDSDLIHLKGIPHLKRLDLEWTSVTDHGMQSLAKYKALERLDLQETKVSDAGLRYVADLSRLRLLLLGSSSPGNSQITDTGLAHLAKLSRLEVLTLWHTNLRGEGLKHLVSLSDLRQLNLRGTPIDDTCLVHLYALKSLAELDLRGTNVTEEGITLLQASLPGCKIIVDAGDAETR